MNLILFDVARTLVQTTSFDRKALKNTLSRILQVPVRMIDDFADEETDTAFTAKVWTMVSGIAPDQSDWGNIYKVFREELHKSYLETREVIHPIGGAPELLTNLQHSGSWGFAIATPLWNDLANLCLRASGFYTRRFHVVSGEDCLRKKDVIARAIESSKRWYGVSHFDKITYVGDDSLENQVCRELNLPFIEVGQYDKSVSPKPALHKTHISHFPNKGQFIHIARRAVVPSRNRSMGFFGDLSKA